ncbi:01d33597-6a5b-45c8-b569-b2880772225a [Thermothielavioides terrestris]|uniref:01d33597-6a5b-45c8-b569-b2880772225a n=1 Tax=Thermothielavioides terrestris TaxID=2587410 RepID=A0A446BWD1_9PEZI|nr:01d33597-6a5b-45c8-b569-b2880772225a [Thermothielavioides terrestris]
MAALLKPALTLHLLIETPAALSFLLFPAAQLPAAASGSGSSVAADDARLVLRNLGGALLATDLLCLVLLLARPAATAHDQPLAAQVCLCLGTYHVWPIHRAWVRMRRRRVGKRSGGGGGEEEKKVLGGPPVHFVVHG